MKLPLSWIIVPASLMILAGCQPPLNEPRRLSSTLLVPAQRPLNVAFWNSSADLVLKSTETGPFSALTPWQSPEYAEWLTTYRGTPTEKEMGFWRMKALSVYTTNPGSDRPIGAYSSGTFYRVQPTKFVAPAGSKIVSEITRRIKIPIKYTAPSQGGGYSPVHLRDPRHWSLSDIGIEARPFSIRENYDDPLAIWHDPKPKSSVDMPRYEMHPVVLAEETIYTLEDETTGRLWAEIRPTGWIAATGWYRFAKFGPSDEQVPPPGYPN